jgi:hypothetical protein
MARFFVLPVLLVAAGCNSPPPVNTDYQRQADTAAWTWSDDYAHLGYSIARHLREYDVEVHAPKEAGFGQQALTVRIRDGSKERVVFRGHWETVLARWEQTLFVADFCPIAAGCTVVAFALQATSCPGHSEYHNRVNIETDGKVVTVWGKESFACYVELVDCQTGKTVGHREFKNQ